MHDSITWIGMDVHKENIVVTAVGHDSEGIKARFEPPNTDKGVHRLAKRLRELGEVRCAYEAGPCGYELRRFLSSQGIPCEVVAPSLIPKKAVDRVKTDRRDAEKLARLHRMGELTAVRGQKARTENPRPNYAVRPGANPRSKSEAAPDESLSCGSQPANISLIIVEAAWTSPLQKKKEEPKAKTR